MKLSNNEKDELRLKLQDKLAWCDRRIKLTDEELEIIDQLIFDYITLSNGDVVKVPAWTGLFLSNLDLSKLSFKNAILDASFDFREYLSLKDLDKYSKIDKFGRYEYDDLLDAIVFSGCNIKINFEELYTPIISFCDLSGVDLSKSNLSYLRSISETDLNETNVDFKSFLELFALYPGSFYRIDFSDNNFKGIRVDDSILERLFRNEIEIYNTNLIIYGVNPELISDLINMGYLDGCYVTGRKILDSDEKNKKRDNLIEMYQNFKNQKEKTIKVLIKKIDKRNKGEI